VRRCIANTNLQRRNEAPLKLKENKMKTRNLLTIGAVTLAAITLNVAASDALLSPRAAGNQIKQVSGTANHANPAGPAAATVSPRAAGNQSATIAGVGNEVNPAVTCARSMNGSPKAIQACVEHTTMPGCSAVTVK
jgi:hypothetical protein